MGEGVHIHLTKAFPKQVDSDFLGYGKKPFFSKSGVELKLC